LFRLVNPVRVQSRAMHDIPERIAEVLLEVEANLRTSGKWEQQPPDSRDLSSTQPFCFDTLSFEQWLQWIFLPRMKRIIEQQKPLPPRSGIHVYAHEYLRNSDLSTGRLLKLIKRFDDLIAIQSAGRPH
jgi:uncharacterized protein YqcC (DUF446 family)